MRHACIVITKDDSAAPTQTDPQPCGMHALKQQQQQPDLLWSCVMLVIQSLVGVLLGHTARQPAQALFGSTKHVGEKQQCTPMLGILHVWCMYCCLGKASCVGPSRWLGLSYVGNPGDLPMGSLIAAVTVGAC